jgi:hypothetical protein
MGESHKRGREFESQINQLIQGIIVSVGAEDRAAVSNHQRLMGKSTKWYPDLVLRAHSLFEPLEARSLELAIIECKYIDETASKGTYWSQMSRAYMSLNDMRLADEISNFYLAGFLVSLLFVKYDDKVEDILKANKKNISFCDFFSEAIRRKTLTSQEVKKIFLDELKDFLSKGYDNIDEISDYFLFKRAGTYIRHDAQEGFG